MQHLNAVFRMLIVVTFTTMLLPPLVFATHGKPHWGAWFKEHQKGDTAAAAIERGRNIFNELGCGGCHPRGGTIGGITKNILGKTSPRPIPDLHGAAHHFPPVATPKKVLVSLGQMNDL